MLQTRLLNASRERDPRGLMIDAQVRQITIHKERSSIIINREEHDGMEKESRGASWILPVHCREIEIRLCPIKLLEVGEDAKCTTKLAHTTIHQDKK